MSEFFRRSLKITMDREIWYIHRRGAGERTPLEFSVPFAAISEPLTLLRLLVRRASGAGQILRSDLFGIKLRRPLAHGLQHLLDQNRPRISGTGRRQINEKIQVTACRHMQGGGERASEISGRRDQADDDKGGDGGDQCRGKYCYPALARFLHRPDPKGDSLPAVSVAQPASESEIRENRVTLSPPQPHRNSIDRNAVRKIIHVDMDAFYASVEQRDNPDLRGQPVIVAWKGNRSVVCAASYEARAFGVRSAMPAMRAERLCPTAVFVAPDFTRYRAVSGSVRDIFRRHTDLVEPLSLDEAYLDVTANKTGLRSATLVARTIREQIRQELHLTASAGVAPNKFLAKLASDWKKPDGLFGL
jgi:hypothetical protein